MKLLKNGGSTCRDMQNNVKRMRNRNTQTSFVLKQVLSFLGLILLTNSCIFQTIPADKWYLEQTPPDDSPVLFPLSVKPGYFAAERIAISNDGRDIYYSELKGYYPNTGEAIKRYSFSDGKWTGPVTLFEGYAAPALSVTGDTMFVETNFETFISVRNGSGWTNPKRIFSELDSAHYYQVTGNGKYYISTKSGNGAGLCDWSKVLIKGADTTVLSLGRPLNTSGKISISLFHTMSHL